MKKRLLAILLTLAMIFCLAACGGTKAPADTGSEKAGETKTEEKADTTVYNVKLSTQNGEGTPMVETFYQLADSLKEKSNGRLVMEVFPSGVLGSDEDMIEQALNGANVLVLTDASRMSNYVPDMACFGLSYFLNGYEDALKILETDTYAGWVEELRENNGIRLFAFNWYAGPRYCFTNAECKTPEDFAGIRMRTGGGSAYFETVSALGATPLNMPINETYSALSSKAIDATEGTPVAAVSNRYFEVCKYVILTEHIQLVNGLMCGEKWFETLPEDLQQLLLDEIEAFGEVESALATDAQNAALQTLIDNGMTAVEVDKDIFVEASAQAYENLGLAEIRQELNSQIGK